MGNLRPDLIMHRMQAPGPNIYIGSQLEEPRKRGATTPLDHLP